MCDDTGGSFQAINILAVGGRQNKAALVGRIKSSIMAQLADITEILSKTGLKNTLDEQLMINTKIRLVVG